MVAWSTSIESIGASAVEKSDAASTMQRKIFLHLSGIGCVFAHWFLLVQTDLIRLAFLIALDKYAIRARDPLRALNGSALENRKGLCMSLGMMLSLRS